MLTFQKQEDPRVKIEDEIRVKIENDPKTKEIEIRDKAIVNHRQMISDILLIVSMLKEMYETKAQPDPSHFGGFSIERVFESLCNGLKFIYSTPEVYSEEYRNKTMEMDKWIKNWLYGETEPLFDANTGNPSHVVVELIDYLYRFDAFFSDMKSVDNDDDSKNKISLSGSVHYDPVYRYQEMCDLLGMQVRGLRETKTYNKSVEDTIVQLYKPVIHVLHPINKGQSRGGEGWARMTNAASQIVDLLQACQSSCRVLEVKYDEEEAVRLTTAVSVLIALVAAPINKTTNLASTTTASNIISGRYSSSSSNIQDRLQHIYDLTRSAHDLYARRVPQREEAKQTILKCIDACNAIDDVKLDSTMFSIIRRSLIVAYETKDIVESVMTLRTALREILHLARHHSIKIRVPIVNKPMQIITTRQEDEANNDIVCQINDLVDELGEATLDGEQSDDRVLSDDTRRRIKDTLKYAKKVNKHDEETLRSIKEIKNMLNASQVTDIGDALTQLSLDLSQ